MDEADESAVKVGDRVRWGVEVPLGQVRSSCSRQQGELIRIDVVKGKVIRLVVFSDSWTFETVSKKDLHHVRKIPLRDNLPDKCPYRIGDVLLGNTDEEFVVSQILPNRMLLSEPSKKRGIIPIPQWEEYVRKSGKRRRKHFRRWADGAGNPYICRVPQPIPIQVDEDESWRRLLRRSVGGCSSQSGEAEVLVKKKKKAKIKKTPILGGVVRTPVR